jgi:hypothetical protein
VQTGGHFRWSTGPAKLAGVSFGIKHELRMTEIAAFRTTPRTRSSSRRMIGGTTNGGHPLVGCQRVANSPGMQGPSHNLVARHDG